jgi:NAD(P)-dependent dehydrogenase (short-subunit alcohol dehydrogenase family)
MNLDGVGAAVSGGASGLGLATARTLAARGAHVTIIDLPSSREAVAAQATGDLIRFAPADVTDPEQFRSALEMAGERSSLRVLVHTAGRGARLRLVDRQGDPGQLEPFQQVINLNLIGSYNALRLAGAQMARAELVDDERGVIVLTSSVAAYEGQIGQIAYAASKAAIVGMTITAARDFASKGIRVCTIAPGIFDTPLFTKLRDDVRAQLSDSVPFPRRLGQSDEFASLAAHIVENRYLNGETIRLDGAIRMGAR